MYCQVFFAQDAETLDQAEKLLYEDGNYVTVESIDAAVQFLSQWDYGAENEYDDALSDEIELNRFDDKYASSDGQYTIVTHRGLYISLWREAGSR